MHIRVIHWRLNEISTQIEQLQRSGHQVNASIAEGPSLLKSISQNLPDVILIDLSRLPSQGRDLAIHFRKTRATRYIPLVFVGGAREKVIPIQKVLPDAVYTNWPNIENVLKKVSNQTLTDVFIPQTVFEAYRGKGLTGKLGIRENMQVDIIGEPAKFRDELRPLPANVTFKKKLSAESDLILRFVRSKIRLEKDIHTISGNIGSRSLWIIWPKKAGSIVSDLTQQHVRRCGLDAGLVDFKVCSVDQNWSGLLFRRRKDKKPK